MFRKRLNLFQDPKIHYPIDMEFANYIAECQLIVEKNRLDLHSADRDKIIAANSPSEIKPANFSGEYGALLVHGLFDSPLMVQDLAESLAANGIMTRSLLLPGHGTVPGALLNSDYREWIKTVKYGVATFANEVKKIFLIGFSTGGTLAIYHALHDDAIDGLCLIAPALEINSTFAPLAKYAAKLGHFNDRLSWLHVAAENDYAKYQSMCFNAVDQVYQLGKIAQTLTEEKKLDCRLFIAIAENDETINSHVTLDYFEKQSNPLNKLILYSQRENNFSDKRITLRNTNHPELNIIDYSHSCLPIAPNNIHYGQNGNYYYASRPDKRDTLYTGINTPTENFLNLLHCLKLSKYRRQCLTYNPDFDFLSAQIVKFIITK